MLLKLRNKFKETILNLAKKASTTGEPIVRSMEYVYPHKEQFKITDQLSA